MTRADERRTTNADERRMAGDPKWRRYLRFFGPRGAADLDDELRFHIEMRVRDYMSRGMSEAEARAATAQRLGDLANARDACVAIATRRQRGMKRAQLVDAFVQDLRFAGRTLRRQKGWTTVAVLTLALGIGANSAMFSVVNHLLLNPIPYPDADRVVVVHQEPSEGNSTGVNVLMRPMGRLVAGWLANASSFESLEPYRTTDVTIERPGERVRVAHTASILPSFAKFAGQRPIVGRTFTPDEARVDAGVVMLSEGMWRAQYGADPRIAGTTITVNGKLLTIIGVMPGVFQLPRTSDGDMDLWLPLDLAKSDDDALLTVGRLRPGVTRAAAARELDALATREEFGGRKNLRFATKLVAPAEMVSFHDSLILLTVAVALVLLIACANVAHLLLARASTRQREMAIRAALGAGTERLFRQLLTESLMLSAAGCAGGLLVGWAGLRLLLAARPESLADLAAARMDGTTLLVTAALSIATGLAFGVIGAVQASRHSTHDTLKAGSLATSAGRTRGRFRSLLVVTEMALCTTLLVGAALLLRSVVHLQTLNPGFQPKGLYTVDIDLPEDRYRERAKQAFLAEFRSRAAKLPGASGMALAAASLPGSAFLIGALQIEGEPDPPLGTTSFIDFNGVEPHFFKVVGLPIVEGDTFRDTAQAAGQVIVNAGMARKYWPNQSALGHKLRVIWNGKGEWKTIVGVAADAFTTGLTRESSKPMLYLPPGFLRGTIVVRTSGDAKLIPALIGIAASIDPHLPPPRVTSVEEAMRKSIARPRFTMLLLMIFTVVAVGLAAIGLYGVLAYTVAERTREIGIRMALGASRRTVAKSVLSQGLVLAIIGAVIGLLAARAGSRLIGSMLYGIQQTDPVAFGAGAVLLMIIALVACMVPMRRALSVDPLIAMRAE
jgi:predicted permease